MWIGVTAENIGKRMEMVDRVQSSADTNRIEYMSNVYNTPIIVGGRGTAGFDGHDFLAHNLTFKFEMGKSRVMTLLFGNSTLNARDGTMGVKIKKPLQRVHSNSQSRNVIRNTHRILYERGFSPNTRETYRFVDISDGY